MRRLGSPIAALGVVGLGFYGLTLGGCATRPNAPPPMARCDFATCGADAASLVKVTADAVGAPPEHIAIVEAQQQFNGAIMIWRATVSGRRYACKEGRDAATRAVHYVDCRPSTDTGALKAFP